MALSDKERARLAELTRIYHLPQQYGFPVWKAEIERLEEENQALRKFIGQDAAHWAGTICALLIGTQMTPEMLEPQLIEELIRDLKGLHQRCTEILNNDNPQAS